MDKGKEIVTKLKVLFNAQLTEDEKKYVKDHITKLSGELNPEVPEIKMAEAKTKDGKMLQYEGELKEGTVISVISENGPSPAPDGVHELEDGTKVTTVSGAVTKIEKVEPVVPADMAAQFSAQKSELEKTIEAKFSVEKANLVNEIKSLKEVQLSTLKALDKILTVEVDTLDLTKGQKPYDQMTPAEKYALENPIG